MVDLARQAFSTTNYDLAAEIYERKIVESGPTVGLYLGLADSCVLCGYLGKALDAYTKAFRLGQVSANQLEHLVNALSSAMIGMAPDTGEQNAPQSDPFSCGSCKSFLNEPVSIICGHTFCKGCVEKQDKKLCKVCDAKIPKGTLRVNVLLSNISERWFTSELRSVKLKMAGNQHFQKDSLNEAVQLYSEALALAPHDHLIASNRCYAYLSQHKYREALQDAELCISLKPDWAKGYFRKAAALSGLNQHEDAAMAFLQCLSLDSNVTTAKVSLAQSIHKLLSPCENELVLKPSPLAGGVAVGGGGATASPASPHTNPLLCALRMGANYSEGQLQDEGHDITMEMLKSAIRQSLQESSQRSARWWTQQASIQGTSMVEENTCGSSQTTIKKCNSAPCLSTCSDCTHCAPHCPNTQDDSFRNIHRFSTTNSLSPPSPSLQHHHAAMASSSSPDATSAAYSQQPSTSMSHNHIHSSADWLNRGADVRLPQHNSQEASRFNLRSRRHVKEELLNKDDFDCALCFRLLFHPVTTPCGHVFCRECLDRSLDHSPVCPLCKSSLLEYLAERRSTVTEAVEQIVQMYFPTEFAERQRLQEEETSQIARLCGTERAEIPVFVCTMAYPQVTCPLHIFEPKYRLMVRQCMESGLRQFGMVISQGEEESDFAEYGTMLEIRDVQYFPDGRSVVETIGGRRFKVLDRGHRDGYCTAKVEFIRDVDNYGEELQELSGLHDQVLKDAQSWFQSLMDVPRQRILSHFGDFPVVEVNHLHLHNGPTWHWWLVAVLPLDSRVQLAILAMRSLKQRLQAIQRVLMFIRRNRAT